MATKRHRVGKGYRVTAVNRSTRVDHGPSYGRHGRPDGEPFATWDGAWNFANHLVDRLPKKSTARLIKVRS